MSDDQHLPTPDPGGSLEPPRTPPPTALATASPLPEPVSGPIGWLPAYRRTTLGRLIDRALDALDDLGDSVRRALAR